VLLDFAHFCFKETISAADECTFSTQEIVPDFMVSFTAFRESMAAFDGEWYNHHANYRQAVSDTLDLKEGELNKVLVLHTLQALTAHKTALDQPGKFEATLDLLRGTNPKRFASSSFLRRYTCPALAGGFMNYSILWSEALDSTGWSKLIRERRHAQRVCIQKETRRGRAVTTPFEYIMSMDITRSTLMPIVGTR
jgi:hypothetical protein